MAHIAPPRILSIQSHVVSGYVGNRAAVFPLQLLGYEVDILNSCILSNHTGYNQPARGVHFSGDDLIGLVDGMKQNGLLHQITHLLTGYIGSASFLRAVVHTIRVLRDISGSQVVFVCDPVLGDNGKLYVPGDLKQVYIDCVLRYTTILTPNAFELGLLSDMSITTEADAFKACKKLHHEQGIETIFVTGTRLREEKGQVSILVSSNRKGKHMRFAVDAEDFDGTFTGTGDLICALLLAWTNKLPGDLQEACVHAMASVSGVLQRTMEMPRSEGDCPFRELRLIQSQEEICNPPIDLVRVRQVDF